MGFKEDLYEWIDVRVEKVYEPGFPLDGQATGQLMELEALVEWRGNHE